jgi:hypothetical protein
VHLSAPSLHPPVVTELEHRTAVAEALKAMFAAPTPLRALARREPAPAGTIPIPIKTVSVRNNFDAYIPVTFKGAAAPTDLLVDSGNSMLVMPRWESIAASPNAADYASLGEAREPWGCPAKVVRGPIILTADDGSPVTIPDCVFYACTGDNGAGERTGNFGAARLSPWNANGWNAPPHIAATLQAPLSYLTDYPFVEFDYAKADAVLHAGAEPRVAGSSYLVLHKAMPAGYRMFDIVPQVYWMALTAKSLSIGGVRTQWPDPASNPLAVVDTGGQCAFLSDPDDRVCKKPWPDPTDNPDWVDAESVSCESIGSAISIGLGDANGTCAYTVDPAKIPSSVRGVTLVICEKAKYMWDAHGMNIGGISALMNSILVDYKNAKVGFKPL